MKIYNDQTCLTKNEIIKAIIVQ